jgi:hypothetical protein
VRRPAAASPTAATATPALMISRPTHSRVIKPAAIAGRDSTARYSAMRGPTAAWRAMAQGGPHQEASDLSRVRPLRSKQWRSPRQKAVTWLPCKGEFEIWLNPEGRDVLVKELQGLSEINDHFHLGRRPIGGVHVSGRRYR